MSSAVEKAVEALELLPEEMREPAAAYLLSQAKKFRALKDAIDEGMADVEAGRVVPWDLADFLQRARQACPPPSTASSAMAATTCKSGSITRTPIFPASSITPIICASWSAG